jgi:hypothetical protein
MWDFGWGGSNFWPVQEMDKTEMAPVTGRPVTAGISTYSHDVLDDNWTIQYKLRAKNSCGYTDSTVLTVLCKTNTQVPGRMSPVTSTVGSDCNVQFQWNAPSSNGGETITEYKIEVAGANSQYFPITACSNTFISSRMSCTVGMAELSAHPINLRSGDSVSVVARAYNVNGWSVDRSAPQGGV